MFFYANYEGSNNKSIFGGGRATVPTEAMRNGDFRGTAIAPRDPTTGQPFADRVIPSGRIDPAARPSWTSSTRCPIRERWRTATASPAVRAPDSRPPARRYQVDYEPSTNDSVFARGSFQHRNPNNIIFEAGNAFTNLPVLNTTLNTAAVIGGWTRIIAPTVVNEFRAGYNYDNSGGKARSWRRTSPPSSASRTRRASAPTGAASSSSSRRERTGRPTSPMPDATSTEPFDRTPFR